MVLEFILLASLLVIQVIQELVAENVNIKTLFPGCSDLKIYLCCHHKYFALNGCKRTVHDIPDRFTAYSLGPVDHVARLPEGYSIGDPIKSLTSSSTSFLNLAHAGANPKFGTFPLEVFKNLLNPCYLHYQQELLVSWRLQSEDVFESSTICRIVRISLTSPQAAKRGLTADIGSNIRRFKSMTSPETELAAFPFVDIPNCEDLRLFIKHRHTEGTGTATAGSSAVTFMGHFARRTRKSKRVVVNIEAKMKDNQPPEIQTCLCAFRLGMDKSPSGGGITVDFIALADVTQFFPYQDQKNWIHFEYNNSISFVTQMTNPRSIVFFPALDDQQYAAARKGGDQGQVVHHCGAILDDKGDGTNMWKYGELRGGTSAIQVDIGGGQLAHLCFFHSSLLSSNSSSNTRGWPRTYAMGAYLFNTTPPFNALAISYVPLSHKLLYSGEWAHKHSDLSFDVMDYIVFPMSVVLDKHNSLFVFFGYQDTHGWVWKLKLPLLLQSLQFFN